MDMAFYRYFWALIVGLVSFGLVSSVAANEPGELGSANSDPAQIDAQFPPGTIELNFDSHGSRMNGHMYLANGPGPHPTVLLLHGFPGNERNLDLAQAMRRTGWNVLFFHYRGAWGSEGTFSVANVIEDVASALSYLRDDQPRVDSERIAIVGHSLGGFATLMGAANDSEVRCAVALDFANMGTYGRIFASDPDAASEFAAYSDNLQMLSGLTGQAIVANSIENTQNWELANRVDALSGKSILVLAGGVGDAIDLDTIIMPVIEAMRTNQAIELDFHVMETDHSFSWKRIELAERVTNWLNSTCLNRYEMSGE
jgi:uncharacterized protein